MRPTVALCMIVKNEAENLPRLFKSIEGCFDDIHITDTGSNDGTVEVAKKLGATVHHFDWINDFAAARNYSFSHATTDYITWIDGDDVLDSKEGFIKFRDNVMVLADYWAATYHYSSDASGRPVCSFLRERVVKRSKQFQWKYFVHEGIMPVSPSGPITTNLINTWSVVHKRTEADVVKDRSRNLNLFKDRKDLDARMKYYYGKELFENGKPIEAVHKLMESMTDPTMEIHDRILAIQYACHAYMACNQFAQAVETAHMGLQVAPNRAEFHVIIADCYLKQNQPVNAIPALSAAKACIRNGVSPIFSDENAYTVYPRNQLARIYFHTGFMEQAKVEAKEAFDRFKNEESGKVLAEIERLEANAVSYKFAQTCDDIVITCPGQGAYEWDHDIAKTKAMGGSETAAIEMSTWLHKLSGRPVKIFNMRKDRKVCNGVEYLPSDDLMSYMAKHKPFLNIQWRHTAKITDAPTFIWSHDLTTPGVEITSNYIKVLALTPFHRSYLNITQGVPESKIHVTRNGLDPSRFGGQVKEKDPFRFVFGSSPDRGLERCIRVLDKVREKYPEVTLHIHYGWDHFYKYGGHLVEMANRLKEMVSERKDWITYHGATQQDALMKSYKASAYVVQPSDWIETSCISAMEFLACGVYPIFRKVGGVADTLSEAEKLGMATLVASDCITELDYQKYIDATIKALDEEAYKRVKFDAETVSWKGVAEQWLKELPVLAYGEVKADGSAA